MNDVMLGSDGLRILEFEKKTFSWDLTLEEESEFSELTEARPVVCGWVPHVVGSDGEWQHSKKLYLSLLMSENLKLKKVNKSFVPEPKESCQSVLSVSRIPMHMKCYSSCSG